MRNNEALLIGKKYSSFIDIIENDNIELSKNDIVSVNETISTQDLFNKLKENNIIQTSIQNNKLDILPLNCRFNGKYYNGENTLYLIEQKPQIRTITVKRSSCDDMYDELKNNNLLKQYNLDGFKLDKDQLRFNLSMPYVVYFISIYKSYGEYEVLKFKVFFRLSPISNQYDYLLKANFLNINARQSCCIGSLPGNKPKNKSEFVDFVINHFWNASYNSDYINNYNEYRNNHNEGFINNYFKWQYMTHKDPMFIYKEPWIKYKYNIKSIIESIVYNSSDNTRISPSMIYGNVFRKKCFDSEPDPENDNAKIYKQVSGKILDNPIYNGKIELSVGESFKSKNKKMEYFIDGFFYDSFDELCYIDIETSKNKKIRMKYTDKLNNFINEQYADTIKYDEYKINDVIFKPGDVIKITSPYNQTGVIDRFVKNIDNLDAIVIGNKKLIINNIIDFEKIDMKELYFQNVLLSKGEEYYIQQPRISSHSICVYQYSDFRNETLYHKFKKVDGIDTITLTDEFNKKVIICKTSDLNQTDGVEPYVYINQIICNKVFYNDMIGFGFLREIKQIITPEINDIMTDENTLFIKSFADEDINFSVGDDVFHINYDDPQMVNIEKIKSFIVNDETISIEMINDSGDIHAYPYIKKINGNLKIEKGTIRKALREYNGFKINDVFKATQSFIPYFPKKNKNVLCGFITETNREPLALFDNGLTIWGDDLTEKFKLVNNNGEINADKFLTTENIRLQPSDLIETNGETNIVYKGYNKFMCNGYFRFMNNAGYLYSNDIDNFTYSINHILMPRFAKTKILNYDSSINFNTVKYMSLYGNTYNIPINRDYTLINHSKIGE